MYSFQIFQTLFQVMPYKSFNESTRNITNEHQSSEGKSWNKNIDFTEQDIEQVFSSMYYIHSLLFTELFFSRWRTGQFLLIWWENV